jgi:hypothetical protein
LGAACGSVRPQAPRHPSGTPGPELLLSNKKKKELVGAGLVGGCPRYPRSEGAGYSIHFHTGVCCQDVGEPPRPSLCQCGFTLIPGLNFCPNCGTRQTTPPREVPNTTTQSETAGDSHSTPPPKGATENEGDKLGAAGQSKGIVFLE